MYQYPTAVQLQGALWEW